MEYKISNSKDVDMGNMDSSFFLIGLLNEFINRFQTVSDGFFEDISWKQCFLIICMQFFPNPPTINELADLVGTSHQNVKQMLLKLEKRGYVELKKDDVDKRKQRIVLTKKAVEFNEVNAEPSREKMEMLFKTTDKNDIETTIRTIKKLDEQLKKMTN